MKVTVLGGGLVGSAIARDLAAGGEFSVRLCDIFTCRQIREDRREDRAEEWL